jgi:predicted nuclease of predicted toxin-antitoxin system
VNVKLLLDENLSPRVAATLCSEGVDACGVRDRGMLKASDAEVLKRAFEEDRVLVTKNVGDFATLAHASELHAGIVMLGDGALTADELLPLLRRVIQRLSSEDMANRVLWVDEDGTMTLEDIPAEQVANAVD